MRIAVLGAGHVGTAIAAAAVDAGYEVDVAASGSPDRIRLIVDVLIPGARAVTAAEAVQGAEFVVIAVPLGKFRSIDPAILDTGTAPVWTPGPAGRWRRTGPGAASTT
jgi:predicted dinucleotide-binding enzyme